MENKIENTNAETTDKKLIISDVRNSVVELLEKEKQIMNSLAVDKLLIYQNNDWSFSRDGKQTDLDKAKYRVGALEDVLKHCF